MKRIVLLFILFFIAGPVYSACLGKRHVIGTGGSTALCVKEVEFKLKKEADALESRKEAYELKRAAANAPPPPKNEGAQSGNTGQIFNLGALTGNSSATEGASKTAHGIALTKHNLTLEWQFYKFPKMDELDRQMPDQFFLPKGIRYDWFFSKNFGFGAIYELYTLKSTRSFDPITSNQDVRETVEIINADGTTGTATREVNRDIPYLFPGAIKSVEFENLWYFVTFNGSLGMNSDWHAVIRFGSALVSNATIEYNDIDLSLDENEYATQPEEREVTAGMPMFLDFAIERWFEGTRLSTYIRWVEADNDTTSRLDFVPMGGTTVGFAVTFGIPALGYL